MVTSEPGVSDVEKWAGGLEMGNQPKIDISELRFMIMIVGELPSGSRTRHYFAGQMSIAMNKYMQLPYFKMLHWHV